MTRKIDTDLINARKIEKEGIVSDGRYIESLEAANKTPESMLSDAKSILGIGGDESILLNFQDKLGAINNKTKAFISLANFTAKAESTGLVSDEELKVVLEVEARLAKVIGDIFDISVEDLYTKEEV